MLIPGFIQNDYFARLFSTLFIAMIHLLTMGLLQTRSIMARFCFGEDYSVNEKLGSNTCLFNI